MDFSEDFAMNNANASDSSKNGNNSKMLSGSGESNYDIIKTISDSLQGRIYLGKDRITNHQVVIKEAWQHLVHGNICRQGSKIDENFLRERELLISLSKKKDFPNSIIKCIHKWDDPLCYYYAMELCECELFTYISQHFNNIKQHNSETTESKTELQIALQYPNQWIKNITYIFHQICTAIEWLHLHGYCHSDLSLENIMIYNMNKLSIKVIDLGLTKKCNDNNHCLFKGRIGKTQYMSPETYNGEIYNGKQNDVYCLGVMLYLMLIGSKPYRIPNENEDVAFRFVINGRVKDTLTHWKRLTFVTDDAVDLLCRMLTYEQTRISLDDVLKHPFFDVLNENGNAEKYNSNNSTDES